MRRQSSRHVPVSLQALGSTQLAQFSTLALYTLSDDDFESQSFVHRPTSAFGSRQSCAFAQTLEQLVRAGSMLGPLDEAQAERVTQTVKMPSWVRVMIGIQSTSHAKAAFVGLERWRTIIEYRSISRSETATVLLGVPPTERGSFDQRVFSTLALDVTRDGPFGGLTRDRVEST